MAEPFEVRAEIETNATPEEVWEAIATGPGIDAWFMGTNEVEPGEGGTMRMTLPAWTLGSTITAWDPPKRLVTETEKEEDGRFMAFEYVIEGREGGTTVVRFVHSGFLAGDGWEEEYDALRSGDPMYLRKLAAYLEHFKGRRAIPVSAYGPQVDAERAWSVLKEAMGLRGEVAVGDRVRFTPDGLPPVDGVVDEASENTLGVRTDDGLYRFIHGLGGTVVLGHHVYADVNGDELDRAWQSWLDRAFA